MGHNKGVVRVLLDTNVLVLSVRLGINIFKAVEDSTSIKCKFIVLHHTIRELRGLAEKAQAYASRVYEEALRLTLENCEVIEVDALPGESVDDILVRYAHENKPILVISNDREVRRRLRRLGHPVGYLDLESKMVRVEGFWY